jgi:hypothetical protein
MVESKIHLIQCLTTLIAQCANVSNDHIFHDCATMSIATLRKYLAPVMIRVITIQFPALHTQESTVSCYQYWIRCSLVCPQDHPRLVALVTCTYHTFPTSPLVIGVWQVSEIVATVDSCCTVVEYGPVSDLRRLGMRRSILTVYDGPLSNYKRHLRTSHL